MGCHALLQGIFLTWGSNLRLTSPALAGGFFTTRATREATNDHTTQQPHYGTYTLRKAQFKKTQVLQCSVQHYHNSQDREATWMSIDR